MERDEAPVLSLVINEEKQGDALILHLVGPITLEQIETLQERLQQAWRSAARRIIIDLSTCPNVDSAGIAVLVSAYKHSRDAGIAFFLVGVGGQVRNILEMTRLDKIFETRSTVEAALGG